MERYSGGSTLLLAYGLLGFHLAWKSIQFCPHREKYISLTKTKLLFSTGAQERKPFTISNSRGSRPAAPKFDPSFEQLKAIIQHHQHFLLVYRKLEETMKLSNLTMNAFYNIIFTVALYQIALSTETELRPLSQIIGQVSEES